MSSRWPGSLINKTAPTSSGGGVQDSAPGVWTLDQINPYIATQTWPGTGTPDPQFQYVTALLHGDGTNGGQNNTFLDSSINNFTITRNGNTTQGSFSPYGSLWSNYFNGSSYLTVPSSTSLQLSGSAYTIEAWTNFSALGNSGAQSTILQKGRSGAGNEEYGFYIIFTGGSYYLQLELSSNGSSVTDYRSTAIPNPLNSWNHCAVSVSGTTAYFWFNGVAYGTATVTSTFNTGTQVLSIGSNSVGTDGLTTGYISNLRIVKGTALYTSAFTPSTTPLTAVSGTSLLTCQSNRFIDNSSNNATITANGTPSVQRFSPFQNLATYQTAKIGGSGYFDGSGDYLTVPTSTSLNASGDFTAECWFNTSTVTNASQPTLFAIGSDSSGLVVTFYTGAFYCYFGAVGGLFTSVTPPLNQWVHLAWVRSSGTHTLYINGVSKATSTQAGTITSTGGLAIGKTTSSGSSYDYFVGYVSDFRYNNTTALYTAAFTPPTAPLTPVTNTQLLTSMTNGSIYDNAAMNDLETVGSAQISTSVVKYGTGSIATSAAGNYLSAPSTPNMVLLGNFTIEAWVYPTATAGSSNSEIAGYGASGQLDGWHFYQLATTNYLGFGLNYSGVIVSSSIAIPLNTWSHVAVSRVGTTYLLFINGNQVGTATSSTTQSTNASDKLYIGTASYDQTAARSFIGYIDDFRITNGYARYWFNFQPPTAAYPNYGGTLQLTYDPYFENTTLLLNGEGTNGAQNNTFLDSSTNNFTITRNGNTTQGSFSPYGSLWSNAFNGTNQYCTIANSSALDQVGDYTQEGWFFVSASSSFYPIGFKDVTGYYYIAPYAGNWTANKHNVSTPITGPAVQLNQWTHVALTRSGSTVRLFVNGTLVGSTTEASNVSGTGTFYFASSVPAGGYFFSGNISNYRILSGVCLYTTNFTPPTGNLTAISGTCLLLAQSNRFIDNSSNNFTVTPVNGPQISRLAPFNPTAPYSTSVIGGSGYFDGSGDYLSVPNSSALDLSADFTIDCWYYGSTLSGEQCIFHNYNADQRGIAFNVNGVYPRILAGNGSWFVVLDSSIGIKANTWNYIAATRSGSTWTVWVNGVSGGTASSSSTPSFTTDPATIGRFTSALPLALSGYVSDLRVVKGTALTITVPTAPLTAVSGTSLLTNFTNAGIPDLAMQNNLETVGNAQVSTSVKKYGTGSLAFSASGNYLQQSSNQGFSFGTGAFTIEFWVYMTTVNTSNFFFQISDTAGGFKASSTNTICFYSNPGASDPGMTLIAGNTSAQGSGGFPVVNTWYHFAIVRNGTTTTLYKDGTSYLSLTDSANYTTPYIVIGNGYQTSRNGVIGYIDDLRITKGLARYTANFTPPTAALPTY